MSWRRIQGTYFFALNYPLRVIRSEKKVTEWNCLSKEQQKIADLVLALQGRRKQDLFVSNIGDFKVAAAAIHGKPPAVPQRSASRDSEAGADLIKRIQEILGLDEFRCVVCVFHNPCDRFLVERCKELCERWQIHFSPPLPPVSPHRPGEGQSTTKGDKTCRECVPRRRHTG